ncbi:MAG: 30S ribosomal protein S12 methylthiotransferase RimO [Paludibacteraceae bacterium]|jgi:ribosomal protein S12 methylthiotransferase RimO|nr:30S ribosomal protein S12 methylthiotransferase RimO [Paludibacteraceae bacterium]
MRKKAIDIICMGCSKNLVDAEFLASQLDANGYETHFDPNPSRAKIVIINTCGFIGDAKEESVNQILRFAEKRKRGGLEQLLVMGCLSERYRSELEKEIPEVDKFYGKFAWKDIIADLKGEYRPQCAHIHKLSTPSHYAYVKVSEGCNRHCAYCAIPLITGEYKSRPMEEIVSEVESLVAQGVKEFQIIAQDLTYYGKDLYGRFAIAELVERISDIKGVEWIRLHYGYPTQFPYDLLRVMRERENVCKYLDIALQHIDDDILRAMRRPITEEETLTLLDRIREEVPGIHIRTTLMVGFPGETEAQFNKLMDFTRKARFERMGAFKYCEEEGTYAGDHLKDNVSEKTKEKRLDQLMALQETIAEELNNAKVGQSFKVIIDRKEDDYYYGRTEFDSPEVDQEVLIPVSLGELTIGAFYAVRITAYECFDLIGELV